MPSCARVKVEVDLLREFSKCINVGLRKKSGEIVEMWININYNYVPRYCGNCKIQGHSEQQCYVLHPELYPKEEDEEKNSKEKEKGSNKREKEEKPPEKEQAMEPVINKGKNKRDKDVRRQQEA